MSSAAGIGDRRSGIDYPEDDDLALGAITGFSESEEKPLVDYRDLEVWRLSKTLAIEIYRATGRFPTEEKYGFVAQMRRASVSIPANIAEGHGRDTPGAYLSFLRIAQGSARELETLIDISGDLGFLGLAEKERLYGLATRCIMMLRRLIQAIERRRSQ